MNQNIFDLPLNTRQNTEVQDCGQVTKNLVDYTCFVRYQPSPKLIANVEKKQTIRTVKLSPVWDLLHSFVDAVSIVYYIW